MQIVIDIPEGLYKNIQSKSTEIQAEGYTIENAVLNGAPLPKGHGRLIDEQKISDYVHSHIIEINAGYGDLNNHTNRILRMIESYIDTAPTIIEADTESEVDNV